jgi:tight adherence protein C
MIYVLSFAAGMGFYLLTIPIRARSRITLSDRLSIKSYAAPRQIELLQRWNQKWGEFFASKSRLRNALLELPEILDLISVVLWAGEGIFAALARVVPRAKGVLAAELAVVLRSLELGSELEPELQALANRLPQRHVIEFANKLALAVRRGSPSAQMLNNLASSARSEIRNDRLKQLGRNETRMLVPLVFMILPVTVLFAIYPSLQLLKTEYL